MRFVVDGPGAKGDVGVVSHADLPQVPDDETLGIQATSHGIRNVVVLVRHASRTHAMYAHEVERPVVLIQHDHRFVPHVLPVVVGQTLRIQNRDAATHIALIRPPRGREMDLLLAPGDEGTWQFTHAEFLPVPVTCTFDPSMRAYVIIVDNPYVAVSDDHGVVALANVPAGEELDLRLWHERSGWLVIPEAPVKGHLRAVVPPDGVLDLGEMHVPPAVLARPIDFDRATHVDH